MINNTEKFVLSIIGSYHETEVPQVIFKHFDNSTIKKALKSLKDKGLIYKKYNLLDMRQRYVCLTEEGQDEIKKHQRVINTS